MYEFVQACMVSLPLRCVNFVVLAAFSQHFSALEEDCVLTGLRGKSDGSEVKYPPHVHIRPLEVDHFIIKD